MGLIPEPSIQQQKMKTFVAITLACFVSSIKASSMTCEECLEFAGKVSENFASEKSVADQTDLLSAVLCPMTEDPVGRSTVQEIIAFLQGDALCATSADPAYCSQNV